MKIIEQDFSYIEGPRRKAYNPAIFLDEGKLKQVYRFEPFQAYPTELGIVDLDDDFQPIEGTKKELRIPRVGGRVCTLDDPRVFKHKNKDYLIHIQGLLNPNGYWSSCQVLTGLEKGQSTNFLFIPDIGRNINNVSNNAFQQACEKNWTAFSFNRSVFIIYSLCPFEIYEVKDIEKSSKPELFQKVDFGLKKIYKKGWVSGGSSPIRYKNGWLSVFHSHVPSKQHIRDYYLGFIYFEFEDGQFNIKKFSKKPFLEADWNPEEDFRNTEKDGWVPNCIFPCGLLEYREKFYVSYGWQDCKCKLLALNEEEIEESMEKL